MFESSARSKKKNRLRKGEEAEAYFSKVIHENPSSMPLLIWPKLLREIGGGQVDLAEMRNDIIQLYEVKSQKVVGVESGISTRQSLRLRVSGRWLASIFNMSAQIKMLYYQGKK